MFPHCSNSPTGWKTPSHLMPFIFIMLSPCLLTIGAHQQHTYISALIPVPSMLPCPPSPVELQKQSKAQTFLTRPQEASQVGVQCTCAPRQKRKEALKTLAQGLAIHVQVLATSWFPLQRWWLPYFSLLFYILLVEFFYGGSSLWLQSHLKVNEKKNKKGEW